MQPLENNYFNKSQNPVPPPVSQMNLSTLKSIQNNKFPSIQHGEISIKDQKSNGSISPTGKFREQRNGQSKMSLSSFLKIKNSCKNLRPRPGVSQLQNKSHMNLMEKNIDIASSNDYQEKHSLLNRINSNSS